ncbi:REP element-mobilizing transposase RayT [Natronospira proteinivora]|uniref:REP element-mobilizing transposase RayT n=1 Tax=Natronospira proteinivora TaxID=1807133 RepID=A0ABT1G953_9GAMM|nr:transposase [Natronospira proteinivora]MCP1727849.1 REP element-mobilizing transposase RayT [Natronospira proteinivora]
MQRAFGGARLLRKGRCSLAGQVYMITACIWQRAPILDTLATARLIVNEFRLVQEERKARTITYVIMPDHFHWLIRLGQVDDLSGVVKQVKARSGYRINKHLGRRGRLWQPGFHDWAIREEPDLRAVARYIVANPLRAGLVEDIGQWPYWDAVWVEGGDEDRPLEP